jgi:hypothetical protein
VTTSWIASQLSVIAPDASDSGETTLRQAILLTLIVAVPATAAVAIVGLITGEFGNAAVKIMASFWAVIGFAMLALAGIWRTEALPRSRLEPLTIACGFLGIVTSLVTVWTSPSELIVRIYAAGWVFAFATAQASLLVGTRRPDDAGAVRAIMTCTLVLIAVAASLIALLLLAGTSGGAIVTITMVVLVLDVMATVLVFLVRGFLEPVMPARNTQLPGSFGSDVTQRPHKP